MFIKNFQHSDINIGEFESVSSASWCFLGDNLSGIDHFPRLLSGELQADNVEAIELPEDPGVLSFARQQKIFEDEIRNDDSDFLDRPDPGTLVSGFIPDWQDHPDLLRAFKLDTCLDRGYRQLSSGQCRKLHLLEQLFKQPQTIIIQNPYEGLDLESGRELEIILSQLPLQGIELILLVNTVGDIPAWCSHLGLFSDGELVACGRREIVLPVIRQHTKGAAQYSAQAAEKLLSGTREKAQQPLLELHDGFAAYGERILFQNLNLTISPGNHTLVSGPNGCGKSTLLDIITGDNPKCYTNDLYLFGQKRGTGESIWDIKKNMGIVSPGLHRDYRAAGTVVHVILSGLHDSIGLYKKVHTPQIRLAQQWLDWIKLSDKSRRSFQSLSYAEQRLVLICRALIKLPRLLILDEPSQGLDDYYRHTLLDMLEKVAEKELSTILFVSHRRDEWRPFFRQHVQLESFTPTQSITD